MSEKKEQEILFDTTKEWVGGSAGRPPLFVHRLMYAGFSWGQIEAVLQIIDKTCPHCWEADAGCQCWNDE